jgi:hypothetical protein
MNLQFYAPIDYDPHRDAFLLSEAATVVFPPSSAER